MKSIEYLIRKADYTVMKVKGYKLDYESNGYTFAVNRPLNRSKGWSLTNLETGLSVTISDFTTREQAVEHLKSLDDFEKEKLIKILSNVFCTVGKIN